MLTCTTEDISSSEDEDKSTVGNQIQVQTKSKNVFYYLSFDSAECSQKFNKNKPLDDADPFIKKLRIVLKKFPSISVVGRSATNIVEPHKRQGIAQTKQHYEVNKEGSRCKSTDHISSNRKFQPRNDRWYANETDDRHRSTLDFSEHTKNKRINLIKSLCDIDDSSFPNFFNDRKQEFLEFLTEIDIIQEVIPQTIEVILKMIRIEHPSLKNILLSLIHDGFIDKIVGFITLLPTECEETMSCIEIESLFDDLLSFCEYTKKAMPLKTPGILWKVKSSLQYAARGLKEVKGYCFNETLTVKISNILVNSDVQRQRESKKNESNKNEQEPPDNVKEIDIYPSKTELFQPPKFLRKNVVNGSYRDVNHYIDVQFRLLREDFIAPLRCGLQLYCESVSKGHQCQNQRFDNIRLHENVKILHGTITNGRLGHLVQLQSDVELHKDSKRFMFGSLVLFTADNFENFFCGSVINPAGKNLLVVELCCDEISLSDIYNKNYTMIESEVFFAPYFHVLTALQQFDHATFPMKEYIVDVNPNDRETKSKLYIDCPSFLNESQKEAFKAAIDNEFVVIQGPPGTGKTFIAEAITKKLLLKEGPILSSGKDLIGFYDESERERFRNLKKDLLTHSCVYRDWPEEWKVFHTFFCEVERNSKPILVICYTNHALDQFLERLINCTKRVIRVGGQSKNSVIQEFNLQNVRRCWMKEQTFNHRRCNCYSCESKSNIYDSYFEHTTHVQDLTYRYLVCLKRLEALDFDGVLKSRFLLCGMSSILSNLLIQQEQFEAWLLEGANVVHIQDKDIDDKKPEFIIHTQQLLDELKESIMCHYDSPYDFRTVELLSTTEADSEFFVKVSKLMSKSENIQKKLRKCRQKGGNETTINMYQKQIEDIEKQRRYISYMLAHKTPVDLKRIRELNRISNIWAIDFEDRWMLYNYWVQQYESSIKSRMLRIESCLKDEEANFIRKKNQFDLRILKSANVIGVTTTGAARLRNILEEVGPEIVLVEEAAEVLEAHVVVSLSPSVKKVILIGDHKQLKPNPAVYEMAQHYKLDVSLFERMINNGLACQFLDTQQRMRPEIASLITPNIYPDLKNGEKVLERPDIRGIAANLFFITHNNFEDEPFGETRSHRNTHEVNFLLSLCQYLLQQDYCPSEITILATYLGQMTALENERRRKNLPSNLRITTVDNYQGEESDIILLSLVRSNAEAHIGFLSAENRVCVALSRARNGLYIIGNMDNLTQSSKVWRQVKAQLEAMNAIGPALPLGCRNHQNEKSLVSCSNDFKDVPVSGCQLKCGEQLQCGHVCSQFCHSFDLEHIGKFACPLPCARMSCKEHKCPKTCGEECGSCSVLVEKQLPCGHSAQLNCSVNPEWHACKVEMTVKLETCGHTVTKSCSENQEVLSCDEPCSSTMDCGHPCTRGCHATSLIPIFDYKQLAKDPPTEDTYKLFQGNPIPTDRESLSWIELCDPQVERNDFAFMLPKREPVDHIIAKDYLHEKRFCTAKIERILDCGHVGQISCNISEEKIVCQEPCPKTLPCQHPCDQLCGEPCNKMCNTLVEKVLSPCGHQLILPCSKAANSAQCRQPCQLNLPCGHPCTGTCSAECSSFICQEKVCYNVEPACGHELITVPCYLNKTDLQANSDQLLQHCKAPCRADLPCGHLCVGMCGACLQGRLHIPCSHPCTRTLKCGHRCERDCCNECPAVCDHPCMYRCPHQACAQLCGDPCTPCQKMCERRCRHQRCSQVCSEDCDCPPCNAPCYLTLVCGHPCRSFCGEPCTKYCVVCHPDTFIVPGHPFNPGVDRYVTLEDCGHPIEDTLLKKLIMERQPNELMKCPLCGETIQFVLRYKDLIKQFYSNIAKAKNEEILKIGKFESKMKTEKYSLKYYSNSKTETYGDSAFFILDHLKKAHCIYKTTMYVLTFFKQLTKADRFTHREDNSWNAIIERRKLLLGALSLRLKSMSLSDYHEFLTEIYRLEVATINWPARSHLLTSLKKYSLEEIKALM